MTQPTLASIFADKGPLAEALTHYQSRQAQIDMAEKVAQAIAEHATVVLEAGTGIGKTAAYLVPALLAGGKVIVSTGTKTLQDQLFHRDLPALCQALNIPIVTSLLKGRANYLCQHYLVRTQQSGQLADKQEVQDLYKIARFAEATRTGDKADCIEVPESASIWQRVTSTRDNCLGSDCAFFAECWVMKARKKAQDADIVVINHHLFFADLMLREEGVNTLLPAAQTIIFDEAHQLPDTAIFFLGDILSSAQILELCRDSVLEGLKEARDATHWPTALAPLEQASRELRLCFGSETQKFAAQQIPELAHFERCLATLKKLLQQLVELLAAHMERSPGLQQLHRRAQQFSQHLTQWNHPERQQEPELCWINISHLGWQLHRTPLSAASLFQRERIELSQPKNEQASLSASQAWAPPAWIFTSATLAAKQDFSHFTRELGLEDAYCQSWSSPFDYSTQALLYVPDNLPQPASPQHSQALVEAALPLLRANRGRAFFLCTTLRAVERIAEYLTTIFASETEPLLVLQQGQTPRATLLAQFRQAKQAVLVGSQSFWEGIDIKGHQLSLVVIDKIPFAPPDDPVLTKRLELLKQAGHQPFLEYQVPQAIISLKQGAGRLIRSETDLGVLMIGDTRLISKPYGRRIWQSLPPMRRTRSAEEAIAFLHTIPHTH